MKTLIAILIFISIFGIMHAHAQSLSSQQIQDLQSQISDDTMTLNHLETEISADQSEMASYNNDIQNAQNRIDVVSQRVNDATAVLSEQANQVNAS